jgi:nucleotide-binding universal stress UspA family protein
MFKHLLVPLDGSNLAESVLPDAAYLSQALNASVTLIHIIEKNAPKEIHSDRHLTDSDEAFHYLEDIAKKSFPNKSDVKTHVHTTQESNVARSIAEHAEEFTPDLVILCSHGRGGMRDVLMGSIAQQVIALGETPVLLIRPEESPVPSIPFQKIFLPLDGNPEHEQSITVAADLARSLQANLHFMMAVPTYQTLHGEQAATGKLLPGATAAMLDLAEQGAEEYLNQQLDQLKDAQIQLSAEVARGDPVPTIVDAANRYGANLIVLGTHGKTGTDAFWSGSTASKIPGRTHIPLLLVPVLKSK